MLFFFFDFSDIEKRGHENMLRSLISQLSMYGANGCQILEDLHSSCMDGERQPTSEALTATLRRMMRTFEEVFIVLDALDGAIRST